MGKWWIAMIATTRMRSYMFVNTIPKNVHSGENIFLPDANGQSRSIGCAYYAHNASFDLIRCLRA